MVFSQTVFLLDRLSFRLPNLKPFQNPNGSLKFKMERRRLVAKWLI
ncbi:hypothetical protein [Kingella oralis]